MILKYGVAMPLATQLNFYGDKAIHCSVWPGIRLANIFSLLLKMKFTHWSWITAIPKISPLFSRRKMYLSQISPLIQPVRKFISPWRANPALGGVSENYKTLAGKITNSKHQ